MQNYFRKVKTNFLRVVMPQLRVGSASILLAVRMTALHFPPVTEALRRVVTPHLLTGQLRADTPRPSSSPISTLKFFKTFFSFKPSILVT